MANPRVAVFPGSFDPPTLGHLDVIRRAARMFDRLVVALLENSAKQPCFSLDERAALLRRIVADLGNVEVDSFGGLLADYARARKATAVVRGIRGATDFEYERQMAETNRQLNPAMDTVFFAPSAAVAHISSTRVREIAAYGGAVHGLVPEAVADALAARSGTGRPKNRKKRKQS
jgi:pantetheine-phosphate adenylyltransferase